MKTKLLKKTKGFTIIEVMIVLAIAGMIIAIVLLAVPALQRNSRNNARRNDAQHIVGIMNEYAANHAGLMPAAGAVGTGQNQVDFTNEHFGFLSTPVAANLIAAATWGTLTAGNINIGQTCDPTANTLSGGNATRSFSVTFLVETASGSQQACAVGA